VDPAGDAAATAAGSAAKAQSVTNGRASMVAVRCRQDADGLVAGEVTAGRSRVVRHSACICPPPRRDLCRDFSRRFAGSKR
jgi:hypothetical protein